jgi:uncharacterized protein (TIGR02246 family)
MTSTVTGENEIRELLAGYAAAMRAGDVTSLLSRFAPDAVIFTMAPPLWNGPERVHDEERMRAWFATFEGPVDYEVTELRVEVDGRLGFCYSLNRLSATPKGMSEGFTLWFRYTACVRRVDGGWLVAHEHTSTPFYMDGSMRAAVDLGPEVS